MERALERAELQRKGHGSGSMPAWRRSSPSNMAFVRQGDSSPNQLTKPGTWMYQAVAGQGHGLARSIRPGPKIHTVIASVGNKWESVNRPASWYHWGVQ